MERDLRRYLPNGRFSRVPAARSKVMRAIKGAGNRTTEKRLRFALVRAGMRDWRVRPDGLPGSPDFVFGRARLAVFTDGCFWHGCRECNKHRVHSNTAFWKAKILMNRAKDRRVTSALERVGWTVLRIWEHELRDSLNGVVSRIQKHLTPRTSR